MTVQLRVLEILKHMLRIKTVNVSVNNVLLLLLQKKNPKVTLIDDRTNSYWLNVRDNGGLIRKIYNDKVCLQSRNYQHVRSPFTHLLGVITTQTIFCSLPDRYGVNSRFCAHLNDKTFSVDYCRTRFSWYHTYVLYFYAWK